MRGNQFYIDGHLYRFDYSGGGPPWPMQVWDDPSQAWQPIGEQASSLLTTGRIFSVLAGDWLQEVSGELVMTDDGDTISCAMPVVLQIPEFVLTNDGDVIGTGGE